jgi:hypothetical protein
LSLIKDEDFLVMVLVLDTNKLAISDIYSWTASFIATSLVYCNGGENGNTTDNQNLVVFVLARHAISMWDPWA